MFEKLWLYKSKKKSVKILWYELYSNKYHHLYSPLKLANSERDHGAVSWVSVNVTDASQFIIYQYRHIGLYQFALLLHQLVLHTDHWPTQLGKIKKKSSHLQKGTIKHFVNLHSGKDTKTRLVFIDDMKWFIREELSKTYFH